mgnify:CR=1 FL=1
MVRRVVVVGSGGAGLTAALAARQAGAEVVVLSKTKVGIANCTAYAGGYFSLASGAVPPREHFDRVMKTGRFVNDPRLVEILSEEGEGALETLAQWGVTISLQDGRASVRRSAPSAVMGGAGLTEELARAGRDAGVVFFDDVVATRIRTGERGVEGVEFVHWRTGKAAALECSSLILASGGGGRIYERTDNPARMTGDGYALALEAGLDLIDMEYVQFYPLGWDHPGFPLWMVGLGVIDSIPLTDEGGREFLLEAVRSWGYRDGGEANLFARDKTSRLLAQHLRAGGKALLHLEKMGDEDLIKPDVRAAISMDLPPERRGVPVAMSPLEHYFCGGVPIDGEGRTSLPGLYACGEVTGGVDGASRMGGNALTNIVTFGLRAGRTAAAEARETPGTGATERALPREFAEGEADPAEARGALQAIVQRGLGPCRNGEELKGTAADLEAWRRSRTSTDAGSPLKLLHALELKGLFRTAEAVAASALLRCESRGAHFRDDYPEERAEWRRVIRVSLKDGGAVARAGEAR